MLSGEWWRLFTAMFVHFGIVHLALNMWCLVDLGFLAEFLFGRVAFVTLYVLSGLGGSVLSLLVSTRRSSLLGLRGPSSESLAAS